MAKVAGGFPVLHANAIETGCFITFLYKCILDKTGKGGVGKGRMLQTIQMVLTADVKRDTNVQRRAGT